MGFWEKAKDEIEKGIQAVEEAPYTQNYDEDDAKEVVAEMKNEVKARELLTKQMGKAPLDRLDEGESLVYYLKGFDLDIDDNDEGSQSTLLVTDQRVVMLAQSITAKGSQYTVNYDDVIGVSVQRRIMSHIRIQTAGHSYKISASGSAPGLADEVVEYIRKRKNQQKSGSSNEETPLDKLERLGKLKEKGVVSEEEFERKKQSLLEDI